MLDNVLILVIGGILAAVCLGVWYLFSSSSRSSRFVLIVLACGAVFDSVLSLADAKSAFAVLIFSLFLIALAKLAIINFRLVHNANYPKHRRCY